MKIQWKRLLVYLAIPLGVGALAGILTKDSMMQFSLLNRPPLSPPGWLFPVVWTVLFLMMGYASYLVSRSDSVQKRPALILYAIQLIVNFFWSIFFFNFEWYLFSFFWLVLLWVLILLTIRAFWRISPTAAILLIPYLLWVTFAGYLNLAIWLIN